MGIPLSAQAAMKIKSNPKPHARPNQARSLLFPFISKTLSDAR
jgi:hypothetical protein